MRIGIDARLYTQTGVGRYLRNLIEKLGSIDNQNTYVVYLRDREFDLFTPPNHRWVKKRLNVPWHTVKEQITVPFILLRDNLDVVHFPYFNVPVLYPKKFLLTIHDLIVDHFDTGRASRLPVILYLVKRWAYKFATTVAIQKASRISVISQTTKKELIQHYHPDPGKIAITYDALDTHFQQIEKTHKPKRVIKGSYILYVGNAYPHKNLERCIDAFLQVRQKNNVKLVLAGEDAYFYPRLASYVQAKKLNKNVIFFGEANDKDLINLYTFCSCLVFPSLMEGFGLPTLEALSCNKLPVLSDIPVFREIWGNNLIYFDPTDVWDMAQKLNTVLEMSERHYSQMVVKAQKRINQFDWGKTAKDTLKLYQEIYSTR